MDGKYDRAEDYLSAFAQFVCENSDEKRFRKFHVSEIKERGYKLDITWLKDESLEDSDELPEPQDLAAEAIIELEAVVDDLKEIIGLVEKEEGGEK
ncbi:MAG: hypothetical protein HY360_23595 [Verrucomicrobia bacterium]|nr:hypothetical protein [Verrucomicrobiota bacterium]